MNQKLKIDQICTEVSKKGYSLIEGVAQTSQLAALNEEFDEILSLDLPGIEPVPYSEGRAAKVFKYKYNHESFPELTNFFYHDILKKLAEKYLGAKVELNAEIFAVLDVVGSRHIANDLHFDVLKTFKFFLYLTDTTEENGAFTLIPGSHKKTAEYRKKYGSEIDFSNHELTRDLDVDDFPPSIPLEGKAGTLIIFDTDTWHKAGIVSSGERRVLRGHTRPLTWKQRIKKTLGMN